jgi:hypothetical protein
MALCLPVTVGAQDAPPEGLEAVELARSAACVPALARMAELDAALSPLFARVDRLGALDRAIALEDSSGAAPFDGADPMEAAVRGWFVADGSLAQRYVAEGDESIQDERTLGREAIRARLQEALDGVRAEAEVPLAGADEIRAAAQPCQGAVLVRSAVVEACQAVSSALCDAVESSDPGQVGFVENAADLWDIQEIRPWTDPEPLGLAPDGTLMGARTAAQARLGNIVLVVGLAPMIRERAQVPDEEAAGFDANLDSLGISFDHPRFVMAPALEVQTNLPAPLDGETHYLLHFGEVTEPDVLWSAPAGTGGLVQAVMPAPGAVLGALQAGEPMSLTAVRMPEGDGTDAEAVFSLQLTPVNQSRAVNALLGYMVGGRLSQDLMALVPPTN